MDSDNPCSDTRLFGKRRFTYSHSTTRENREVTLPVTYKTRYKYVFMYIVHTTCKLVLMLEIFESDNLRNISSYIICTAYLAKTGYNISNWMIYKTDFFHLQLDITRNLHVY